MAKGTHTHRGTCQACGRLQAVDNSSRNVAKHGYTVDFGYFHGNCPGGQGYVPAEFDVALTHQTIVNCSHAAEKHDHSAAKLKSGVEVPNTFDRWNPKKKVTHTNAWGKERTSTGGFDTLPIAQATAFELAEAIKDEIAVHERHAKGLRGHIQFLSRNVLTQFGHPLETNETKRRVYVKGMVLVHNGTCIRLTRPAYSSFGNKPIGWYAVDVGSNAKGSETRYTTRELNKATIRP